RHAGTRPVASALCRELPGGFEQRRVAPVPRLAARRGPGSLSVAYAPGGGADTAPADNRRQDSSGKRRSARLIVGWRQDGVARYGRWNRIVETEMQAAAFPAVYRRLDDQFGDDRKIAQFEQRRAHAVVAVVLMNFVAQQFDPVLRALQTLVGAHDADVVPHKAPYL